MDYFVKDIRDHKEQLSRHQKLNILSNALRFGILTKSITQKQINRLHDKCESLKKQLGLKDKPLAI